VFGLLFSSICAKQFSNFVIIWCSFKAHAGHSGRHFFGHNLPAAAAREVFKPSTASASLVVPSQKKSFSFGLGFSWGDVTSGVF